MPGWRIERLLLAAPAPPGSSAARMSQEELGRAKRSQEESGGARRSQGEPGEARGSQEEPGEAWRSQEEPGGARSFWGIPRAPKNL